MKCEECEYRFICFTLANNERPKRVKVNRKVSNTCGNCRNSEFLTKTSGYRTVNRTVGFCDTMRYLIHKNSTACEKYHPRKLAQIDKMYEELDEVLRMKNRKTKLPKYCVEDD